MTAPEHIGASVGGSCGSCEVAYINGVRCHEAGCPDAWQDSERYCDGCGCDFQPEERWQRWCSPCCAAAAYGHDCECAECAADLRDQPEEDAAGRMGTADYEQAPGA